MKTKVEAYIKKHCMIEQGGHVCVGVSGGADSVCLLLLLESLSHTMGFSLSAVHIEHGIRGEESLKDMEFVRELAKSRGISFSAYSYPVERLAAQQGLSVEEAGRNARYEAFFKEAARYGGNARIALGHHADDNAETILFHLCRGSGIDGLAGIRPVRDQVIRPLLCVTRAEIEAFLAEEGQVYRTDATNADLSYSRNRIRNSVMPQLAEVNVKAVWHMNQTAEEILEFSEYLSLETERILNRRRTCAKGDEIRFSLAGWEAYPPVLQSRVLFSLLKGACGSGRDLTRAHAYALQELAAGRTGRRITLPYGILAEKSYGELLLRRLEDGIKEASGEKMRYRLFDLLKKDVKIPQKLYTKWFDYDKIKNRLYLRTRQPGDYFEIDGKGHRQKLKDYWINEKVPRKKRDQTLLLAEGSHILWAVGYRISEYYKVTEQTKRVLEVQYMEEEE